MSVTVKRGDIEVSYRRPERLSLYPQRSWTAHLHGRLSTGEAVSVKEDGFDAEEALLALELRIKQSGWEIEGGWTPAPTTPRKSLEEQRAELAALRSMIDALRKDSQ